MLTPNHFLIGNIGGQLAPDTVDTTAVNVRKRWRRVQELIRRVWSRWMREYLTSIGSRHKWFLPTENIKVGDVVLVLNQPYHEDTGSSEESRQCIQVEMD